MAQKLYPVASDSVKYYTEDILNINKTFIRSKVIIDNGLKVSVQSPASMKIYVGSGTAIINGYHYFNSSTIELTISSNTSAYARKDAVVVHLDGANSKIKILEGSPNPNPTIPTEAYGLNYLLLAEVYVGVNVVNILDTNITDVRTSNNQRIIGSLDEMIFHEYDLIEQLRKGQITVSTVEELKEAIKLLNTRECTGKILIKAGTYYFTESFELPAYTHIAPFGNGEVIFSCNNPSINNIFRNKLDGTEGGYDGSSHITIEGISFDAFGSTHQITPVAFAHAKDCKVINCAFKNFNTWHNIEFNGCNSCYVEYCDFLHYGLESGASPSEVIQIDYCGEFMQYPWTCKYDKASCDTIYIRHCRFIEIAGACLGNHLFDSTVTPTNIHFENNFIANADYGVYIGDVNNLHVKNNIVNKVRMFVELKGGSGRQLYNWFIENNDVDLVRGGTFHGVEMEVNTEGRFCRLEPTNHSTNACVDGLFINNNHVNNANTHGITFSANFVECNNNYVRGCGKIGIFAYGCSQSNITNNIVIDCGSNNVDLRKFDMGIGHNPDFRTWRVNCANNVCRDIAVFGGTDSAYVHDNIAKIVEIDNPTYVNNNNHDMHM